VDTKSVRKKPTIRDVAAEAGVSHGTVSRVLNGGHWVSPEAREAVEAATAELDTADDLHASAAYRRRVASSLTRRAIADARDEAGGLHAR